MNGMWMMGGGNDTSFDGMDMSGWNGGYTIPLNGDSYSPWLANDDASSPYSY